MASRITIIGLGLIGGSIGLALKKAKIQNVEIVGHDRDPEATAVAKKRGAIDKGDWNLINAVEGASIVIIATPVLAVKATMELIAEHLAHGAIVTDTASTKAQVLEWADQILPRTPDHMVHFIGGHPMAGKETAGIGAADADLFRDATYCLCPSKYAEQKMVDVMVGLTEAMQARPYWVDPHEHDGLVAGVSHLPIIVSSALVSATTSSPSWREMKKVASSGFRDTTRLASGDATMNLDICMTNREAIVGWIDRYIDELRHYRALVVEGGEPLAKEFLKVQDERDRWIYGKKDDDGGPEDVKSVSLGQMLMGERLSKMTDYMRQSDKKEKKGLWR